MQNASVYGIWKAMHARCSLPSVKSYNRYGGRGIKVCERWRLFENFVMDMGPRPEGMTLERNDNNGDYEPANCVWATRESQANNRISNRFVDCFGKRMTVAELARKYGMRYATLWKRLSHGMSPEQAIRKESMRQSWFACSESDAVQMRGLVNEGVSRRKVAKQFGVSRTVVARALQEAGAK